MLIPTGVDADVELEVENTQSFIEYSSAAIDMVRGALLPMSVLSWREIPM